MCDLKLLQRINDVFHALSPFLTETDPGFDVRAAVRDLDPFFPAFAAHTAAFQFDDRAHHADGL